MWWSQRRCGATCVRSIRMTAAPKRDGRAENTVPLPECCGSQPSILSNAHHTLAASVLNVATSVLSAATAASRFVRHVATFP